MSFLFSSGEAAEAPFFGVAAEHGTTVARLVFPGGEFVSATSVEIPQEILNSAGSFSVRLLHSPPRRAHLNPIPIIGRSHGRPRPANDLLT
jgi:hypothetical protein